MQQPDEKENINALSSLLQNAGLSAQDFIENINLLAKVKKENIEEQNKPIE